MPRASLLIGLTLALAACQKPKPKAVPAPTCGAHVCGTYLGLDCGTCADESVCAADGLSCRAALPVGSPCQADLDCGTSPLVCLGATDGLQAPNGYCSEPCGGDAGTCPSGSTCQQDVQGDSVCLATCSGDSACRASDGYTCTNGSCQACVGSCTGKACGDDGCGGSCGITTPMVPACDTASEVCSAGQCSIGFNKIDVLPNTDYPYGLWDAAAVDLTGQVAGGGVAIIGGREAEPYENETTMMTSTAPASVATVDVYVPGATGGLGTFSSFPPLPSAIARPNAVAYSGSLFVAGGTDVPLPGAGGSESADDNFYWETTTSSGGTPMPVWAARAMVPDPSMGGGAAVLGNTLYLVVGQTTAAMSSTSSAVDTYDLTQTPGSDVWNSSPAPARPTARSFVAVATDGTRLFVIGGSDGTNALGTVEVFDPAAGWTTWPPLPLPTVDPRAAIASGRLFVIGGHEGLNQDCCQIPYVQTIDLTTGNVQLLGTTYQELTNQAVVSLQSGSFLLFGAEAFGPSGEYAADSDVVELTIPTP